MLGHYKAFCIVYFLILPPCLATDELIRHVTLDGPERGLLCLRVRDEIRMTIDAYKTLYDSSVTFGVKKQLQAEQGMAEMEDQVMYRAISDVAYLDACN